MGMLAELNVALSEAFSDPDGLRDAVRPFTASRTVAGSYNPATGQVQTTSTSYSGRGIFASYSAQDIDGSLILATDERLTALQSEVTARPRVGDKIGLRTVESVQQDAVGATWQLQLRA